MSYLLPHFQLKTLLSSGFHTQRNKEHSFVRTQCVLSTTSTETSSSATSTITLDMEKLRLSSLETQSDLFAANRPWSYIGTIGPSMEANYEATVPAESLLTSDEAVIAAAAEEALTLAKAALRSAKDAALILKNISSSKANTAANTSLKTAEARMLQIVESEDGLQEESDDLEPSVKELQYLEEQFLSSVNVKSKRQKERKAKRARAAEKSAATVVSVKSGSTSRKKRASSQDVDYSDPLWYLRGTTSSTKLLTASEELQVSAGIQDLLKLEKLNAELKERCGGEPTFSQWAAAAGVDQRTLRRRLSHGTLCKDKMIKSNIRLVISIAKNYQGSGMTLQDLVQEGCRGLVRGAEKFDASKGFKFSTYGHWWIKQAVRKSLSDQSRTIRLPFHMVEATYRVKEARKQLYSETGKHPNMEEIAEATGLSLRRLNAVMMTPKAPRSLDQKIGPNLDLKPSEVIADPNAETLDEVLIKQMMRQDLAKVLDTLNSREKEVVRWRYGLEGGRMKTLQEIGELMGVSRERIRQIEIFAFRKLKNKSRMQHLEQYSIAVS